MNKVLVVGVAGGTGSGKTTFTSAIVKRLGSNAVTVTHDNYYRAHDDLTYDERTLLNYDHPDAYETELLVEHLAALKRGEPIEVPVYDFTVHNRSDKTITVFPKPVIIVEGILILADKQLRDLMDIKVFVDVDADIRILRRLVRDVSERGRSIESVIDQYLWTVKPMHEAFVEPSKRFADIIVPATTTNEIAQEMLTSRILLQLETQQALES